MKSRSLCILLACTSTSFADHLIDIPTGLKVFKGTMKMDWQHSFGGGRMDQLRIGIPVGEVFDLEIAGISSRGQKVRVQLNGSYQFMVPVPDVSPGVSVGIQDIGGQTKFGRSAYLALTYKTGQATDSSDVPAELTVGLGTNRFRGIFLGMMLPLQANLRLIAEHDSRKLTAGFELRAAKNIGVRWLFDENRTRLQLTWVTKL